MVGVWEEEVVEGGEVVGRVGVDRGWGKGGGRVEKMEVWGGG